MIGKKMHQRIWGYKILKTELKFEIKETDSLGSTFWIAAMYVVIQGLCAFMEIV